MSHSMHQTSRMLGGFIGLVLILAMLGWGWLTILGDRAADSANPYAFDLTGGIVEDPGLVRWTEVRRHSMPSDGAQALAVDASGQAFVIVGTEILVFDAEGAEQRRIALSENGRCLAVDASGAVFVGFLDHVAVFAADGTPAATWTGLGESAIITSIAVSATDVLVADCGNRVLWRFDREGRLLARIDGRRGAPDGVGFIIPSASFDVAFAPDGTLWAVNPGRQRLENYALDGSLKRTWGVPSMDVDGFSGCCNPTHIAVLPDGRLATAEKGVARVKVHRADGTLDGMVAGTALFTGMAPVRDLATCAAGRVYVLDGQLGMLRVFAENEMTDDEVRDDG